MRSASTGLALGALLLLAAAPLAGCRASYLQGGACCPQPAATAPCAEPAPVCDTGPVVATAPAEVTTGCSNEPGPAPGGRPPSANPGEAWCQVWIPPVHETRTKLVCVERGRTVKRWIPPVYGTRPILECISGAKISERVAPASFTVRQRELLLRPETVDWQRINCGGVDECGRCRECWTQKVCPPVTETVCERCCLEPSKLCIDYTPAKYRCVYEKYEIKPGFCQEVCIPPRYETRTEEVCTCPGRWIWRRNTECEVPEPVAAALPALQVELIDQLPSGQEAGIFTVGQQVRYSLRITHDDGSMDMADMRVVFDLPEELRFVSGGGEGIEVTGSGQSAQTSSFALDIGQVRTLYLLAEVVSVSPNNLVQLVASIRGHGYELARETESTTVKALAQPVGATVGQ